MSRFVKKKEKKEKKKEETSPSANLKKSIRKYDRKIYSLLLKLIKIIFHN
jgi:hypothetical protein